MHFCRYFYIRGTYFIKLFGLIYQETNWLVPKNLYGFRKDFKNNGML